MSCEVEQEEQELEETVEEVGQRSEVRTELQVEGTINEDTLRSELAEVYDVPESWIHLDIARRRRASEGAGSSIVRVVIREPDDMWLESNWPTQRVDVEERDAPVNLTMVLKRTQNETLLDLLEHRLQLANVSMRQTVMETSYQTVNVTRTRRQLVRKCRAGHYDDDDDPSVNSTNCVPCQIGSACPSDQAGLTIETLPIAPGYYRAHGRSKVLRRCPDGNKMNNSGCVGTAGLFLRAGTYGLGEEGPCRPGLTGPYCRICDESNTSRYYSFSESDCKECPDPALPIAVVAGLVALALAVTVAWYLVDPFRTIRCLRRLKFRLNRLVEQLSLRAKLKQLVSFYQVACRIESVYHIQLPHEVQNVLSYFEVFSLSLAGFGAPLECLSLGHYDQLLAFFTFAPMALGVLIVLFFQVRSYFSPVQVEDHRRSTRERQDSPVRQGLLRALPSLLFMFYLVLPVVSSLAVGAFDCEEFDYVPPRRHLRADFRVDCDQDTSVRALAWVAIVFYPVALPVTYVYLLRQSYENIKYRQPSELSRALAFLHRDFEPRFYYWQVVEELKKLFLVAFVSLPVMKPGTTRQLANAFAFCLTYLLLISTTAPYVKDADDSFAKACSFALAAIFFLCVLLNQAVLIDSVVEFGDFLPSEMKDRFVFGLVTASFLLVILILSAIVLAVGFTIQQVWVTARLPIVKLISTQSAPDLTLQRHHRWHLFLSHVWGTGQDQCAAIKRQLCLLLPGAHIFLDVDDLEDINRLEEYIRASAVIMIFASKGYVSRHQTPNIRPRCIPPHLTELTPRARHTVQELQLPA